MVTNEIVKMEWEKSGWLQTKKTAKKDGTFIFASKSYPSSTKNVDLTVFFTASLAFLWISDAHTDEEDYWNAQELKDWCKTELNGSFPEMYDECVMITSGSSAEIDDAVLEEYGLTEFKSDIEARLLDLRPYGDEIEVKLG